MEPFVWQLNVYYEDTDAGGVVYHARYLNFFERARTEWLRSIGVHQAQLMGTHNRVFAIRHMDIEFHRAARLDDVLNVSVAVIDTRGVRMRFKQEMFRESDQALIASAEVTAVSLKADSFEPARIPAWILAEIENAK